MSRTIHSSVELEAVVSTKDSVSRKLNTVVPCSSEIINKLLEQNQIGITQNLGSVNYAVEYDDASKQLVLKLENSKSFAKKKDYSYYAGNDKKNTATETEMEARMRREFEQEMSNEEKAALKKILNMLQPTFDTYSEKILEQANQLAVLQALQAQGYKTSTTVDEKGNFQIIAQN